MALKLPKNAEKKPTGGMFLKDEGLYKVVLKENEDKVDEKEGSKRKGYSFHNLKFQFENNRSLFARIYYQNEEGDIVPEGYNFILGMSNILKKYYEDDPKTLAKIEDADSNRILDKLIKEKITFYIATKNSIYNGTDMTNVNTFIDPLASLREAEDFADKRKMNIIELTETKGNKNQESESQEEEDDDDL